MSDDLIVLSGMRFEGRHGVSESERAVPQVIELDVEMGFDLREAGGSDDLARTVDYGPVFELCRSIVEGRTFRLLEGIAEAVAGAVLETTAAEWTRIRVRKPGVPLDGEIDFAGVEIRRTRAGG